MEPFRIKKVYDEGYEDFFGEADIDGQVAVIREVFAASAEMRVKLGKKGYLLETYLSMFLTSVAALDSVYVDEDICEGDLKKAVSCALDSEPCKSPFYGAAKAYIDAHPLAYQERATRRALYCIALFGDYVKYQADRVRALFGDALGEVLDTVYFDKLREKISAAVGAEPMEKLDNLLRRAFLFVTPMDAFMRRMNTALLYELIYRDIETSRLAAGLWLDGHG